jgi:CRISPR type I-D-associated protein Csc2
MTEQTFTWSDITTLVPTQIEKKRALPPHYTLRVVTIVGIKTTVGRFMPVSHEGESNETYVDKVDLLGKQRAEFIARKLKAIERRAHMRLFRELVEKHTKKSWIDVFTGQFGRPCEIPDGLCTLCWNDSLFGSLRAGEGATFSRARYFDTYSLEDAGQCVAQLGSEESMAVGNTVGEDLSKGRGDASLHYYEYVKPGTHFPFITVIEAPTLLDVAGLLNAITLADSHGYGKYSANTGKFQTEILAVSSGLPRFSVLDMLEWAIEAGPDGDPVEPIRQRFDASKPGVIFEDNVHEGISTLFNGQTEALRTELDTEFKKYLAALS